MRNSVSLWLVVIAAITILALYMIWPDNPGLFGRDIKVRLGLDIQGGVRVLLAPQGGAVVDAGSLEQAKQIIDRRVNGLGVAEPVVQVSGNNRIVVELPGITNPDAAIQTIQETGLLEFVDFSKTGNCPSSAVMPTTGQYIVTDRQVQLKGGATAPAATGTGTGTAPATTGTAPATVTVVTTPTVVSPTAAPTSDKSFKYSWLEGTPTTQATAAGATPTAQPTATSGTPGATPSAGVTATQQATGTVPATPGTPGPTPTGSTTPASVAPDGTKERPLPNPCNGQPFNTVMSGAGLQNAEARIGGQANNQYVVGFTLVGNEESQNFARFTGSHIGQPMAIVLDGQVLSAPTIQAALTTGGEITGNFTQAQAQELALQLRYGALPISLFVESKELVGASLGAESIQASVRAGILGIVIVLIFMLVSYRVPGALADVALLLFAAINFALYKFIPVTLTLPSLIGFLISVGAAVDGNILIFERIKEELRAGRTLDKAIDLGFSRAWPSIRDSNISTIVIGLIIYFFGGQFGASTVRGFAITLIMGLVTNLFTAIIVTRTFIHLLMVFAGDRVRQLKIFG